MLAVQCVYIVTREILSPYKDESNRVYVQYEASALETRGNACPLRVMP